MLEGGNEAQARIRGTKEVGRKGGSTEREATDDDVGDTGRK